MKRALQLVALAIATLLVVQPAFADMPCATPCCATAMHAQAVPMGAGCGSMEHSARAQSNCSQITCCDVSPQSVPQSAVLDKSKTNAMVSAAVVVAAIGVPETVAQAFASAGSTATALPRYLLLQVFRI